MRRVAMAELKAASGEGTGENVFALVRRIGQAKAAALAADYAAQLSHSVGKVVFFAKHLDVMDKAEQVLAEAALRTISIRGQTAKQRQDAVDAFQKDPGVRRRVRSSLPASVSSLHASSNVVLAELSWTAAEQQQAIDRVHRIGQDEPVTAWRILAAGTVDARIAELIDAKQGLALRALDGSDVEVASTDTVQLDALVTLLRQALNTQRRVTAKHCPRGWVVFSPGSAWTPGGSSRGAPCSSDSSRIASACASASSLPAACSSGRSSARWAIADSSACSLIPRP